MKKIVFFLTLLFASFGTFAMSNPASENCTANWGEIKLEKIWDGSVIGVCYFDDNRQCEEWAMYRNECPVGWLKVTGYVLDSSRYCAIVGGTFTPKQDESIPEKADQLGTCTLPNGKTLNARDLYNNKADSGLSWDFLSWEVLPLSGTGEISAEVAMTNTTQSCGSIWAALEEQNMALADAFVVKYNKKLSTLSADKQEKLQIKVIANLDKFIQKYEGETWDKYTEIVNVLRYIECMIDKSTGVDNPDTDTDTTSQEIQTLSIDDITDVMSWDDRVILYDSGYIVLNIKYPVVWLAEIDDATKTFVYSEIENFIKDLPQEKPYVEDMQYSLYIDYTLNNVDNKYITIKFSLSSYFGWAHPSNYIKTFNFDKETQKDISLEEYLTWKADYLTKLSNLSYAALSGNEALTDLNRIKEWTAATGTNYQFFNVIDWWLTVYFPAYQVGPYAAWEQSIDIKLDDIK